MTDELISAPKIMTFLRMLPSVNKNFKRRSNPMLQLLYLYLSGSAFFVNFADPNKQLLNVKCVFKFLNDGFSMQEIYIPSLGKEILFIKQYPLKLMSGNT